jgi:5'-3' exonuclease
MPTSETNKVDLVCDGSAVFARAFYASQSCPLTDRAGKQIAGIAAGLGIVLSLLDCHSDRIGNVGRTLFCWDTASKTIKPRREKPTGYDEELARFTSVLTFLFGSAHAIPPAHEADDAVCTAVYRLEKENARPVYVVSSDKDLHQLHGGNIHYYCLHEKAALSRAFILHRWKVKRPVQIAIALAILGDPGDAVPGIKGWGPKKVEKLFEAVTEDMDFEQALGAIDAQIPADLKSSFYTSLDLTLLDPGVPGVPEPAPLVFGDSALLVEDYRLPGLAQHFSWVKRQYTHEEKAIQDYEE